MFGVPTGDFLIGVGFAIAGVGSWVVGLGVAYLLYRRWRGDGPRDEEATGTDGVSDDDPRAEN
ncbi:hypothetical protein [Halorubrum amylolyticum]|uniref:hypothetical protein n=1 Tax=Halorubrum amylolyticum TaxID=2508724 RepID=UPI0010090F0A|nr:hypothetical protein [Halorubrum amylolyticum]